MKKWLYIFLTILFFMLFVLAAIMPAISTDKWYISLILAIGAGIDAGLFLLPFYKLIAEQNKIRKKLEIHAFTDRDNELKQVCEIIRDWAIGKEVKPICILCNTNASGRTYFMLKIWHTLISRREFFKVLKLKFFNLKNLKMWKKINRIVYIDCDDESEENKKLINKIDYKTHKRKVIYLFDNLNESIYENLINKYNLMKFIYSYDSTFNDAKNLNHEEVKLTRFLKDDLITYYIKLKNIDNSSSKIKSKSSKSCFGIELDAQGFEIIINLTGGNIKQISKIFDNRKNISSILQFDESNDEYQIILNKIDFKLLIGDYNNALEILNNNKEKFVNSYIKYKFRYTILYAHCLHLLNKYEEAIDTLSVLLTNYDPIKIDDAYEEFNQNKIINLNLAHYKKHTGDFESALGILKLINSPQSILGRLGICAADYFLNGKNLELFLLDYEELRKIKDLPSEQKNKFYRYSPIYYYFKEKKLKEAELGICIKEYEKNKDHLIANALFMKAEIFRLRKCYLAAKRLYLECLDYAYSFNDENLKLQVSMMINYLLDLKRISIPQHARNLLLSYSHIKSLANKYNMQYNYDCACLFNSVYLKDPDSREKIRNIDSRFFVIL